VTVRLIVATVFQLYHLLLRFQCGVVDLEKLKISSSFEAIIYLELNVVPTYRYFVVARDELNHSHIGIVVVALVDPIPVHLEYPLVGFHCAEIQDARLGLDQAPCR